MAKRQSESGTPDSHDKDNGWRMVRFGDVVCDVNESDRNPLEAGLERYIGLEHIEPENLHIKEWGDLTQDEVSFTKRFRKGQVLFGKRRAYQRKVALAEFDGICSGDILTFEPKDETLLSELLPFIVQSDLFFDHALGTSSGSLSPRTRWSQLRDFTFPLPPEDLQRRVAEMLSLADVQTVKVKQAVEQTRLLQKVVFRDLSNRGHQTSFGTVRDAIVDIIAGKSPSGSSEPALGEKYGVLKVSAVGAYGFVEQENKELLKQSEFVPELEVKSGFLLVTRANAVRTGVGRACIVEMTRPGLMLSDKTLRLVVDEDRVLPRFLLEALRSRRCRRHIEAEANGTDAKNISQVNLKKAPIWLPSLEKQIEVVAILEKLDASIRAAEMHCATIRDTKRALRERLVRGTWNVQ